MLKLILCVGFVVVGVSGFSGVTAIPSKNPPLRPPERGIWVNHVGFLPGDVKYCVIPQPPEMTFKVQTVEEKVEWRTVYIGKLEKRGDKFVGDFSCVTNEADYRIVCGEVPTGCGLQNLAGEKPYPGLASRSFVVWRRVHENTERILLSFYTAQRCGSPKGWAGVCHQDKVPVREPDGTVVKYIDARGGYHQSCDLRCWNDGVSASIYGLIRYAEKAVAAHSEKMPELLEEIEWGCDYFCKIARDDGMVYDCQFVPIGYGPRDYYNRPTPLGAHYNIARMLARAAAFVRGRDDARAARYLDTARRIYAYTLAEPYFDKPYAPCVEGLPRGTQKADFYLQSYRGSATSLSGKAALELDLFRTTRELAFAEAARATIRDLLSLQTRDGELAGMFREAPGKNGAGLLSCSYLTNTSGELVLAEFSNLLSDAQEAAEVRAALLRIAAFYRRLVEGVNFGFIPRISGNGKNISEDQNFHSLGKGIYVNTSSWSPSQAAHLALLFDAATRISGDTSYRFYAQRCLDWIFGVNPDESSFIVGIGYTRYENPVLRQFFPSTPALPGAVFHVRCGEYDMPATAMLLFVLSVAGE